jgi:hypothetical protein
LHDHDDRWSFILPYVVLSVVLSVFVSLFWLLVLVVIHFLLEWAKMSKAPAGKRFIACLSLTQLDWALLLAAVCMEVYLEASAGLAGAGQFFRGLGRILGRFPAWQQSMRAALLSADDALQLVRLKKEASEETPETGLQKIPMILFIVGTLLLVLAPVILPIDTERMLTILQAAFRPIP